MRTDSGMPLLAGDRNGPKAATCAGMGFTRRLQARAALLLYDLANAAVGAMRWLCWPRPRPDAADRVCIYRIGNVGDIICALPAMHAIRRAYPNARLTLLTSPGTRSLPGARELLAGARWLDALLVYDADDVSSLPKRLELIRALRREAFDVWIELPSSAAPFRSVLRNMLLARLAGARWGYGWRHRTIRWGARAQSEAVKFPNEVEALLAVTRRAGLPVPEVSFGLPIEPRDADAARSLVADAGLLGMPLVALAPGAKRSTNRWPVERYAAVCRHLADKGFGVVAVGAASERDLCETVAENGRPLAMNAAGRLSLLESVALLRLCALVVSNDSGVQHMAAAVGVPSVSLFSARELRGKWHPYGGRNVVLEKWVDCHTCFLEVCPYDNRCVKLISTDEVCGAIEAVLGPAPRSGTARRRSEAEPLHAVGAPQ